MAKEPKKVETEYGSGMTSEGTGIGTNVVEADDPPFKPTVLDADGNVVEVDDLDDEIADYAEEFGDDEDEDDED